ncbi:hypothetical protein NXT08_00115 [Rhodococcus pyridinivorans]|uniref:hypothetical protein n=1 Tax=Rhodococcus pyridinivorans TaxID=103816 RepID=UPI00216430A0|nr:hypothetical protein [Rhodococcus pyridinivorans]UVT25121.1 hypothetical protein NXT08_00115 [Rhodococcus pyridinivorans]
MGRVLPWASVVVLVVAVLVAGWTSPPRTAPVGSDTLGPDNGEAVADYLARAADSLSEAATDGDLEHWGLVSFTGAVGIDRVVERTDEVRVAQVLFRVPIDRVQTPLVPVAVPENPEAVRRAPSVAAGRLSLVEFGTERAARVGAVSAQRLADGCDCVVAAVLRGTPSQFRAVADAPDVRAVEVLPADAIAGRFAVTPLLPTHVETVVPGPDDGEV